MNHPKDTAPIAAFRNVETTVKTLAADRAISAERALNAGRDENAVPCSVDHETAGLVMAASSTNGGRSR
jgi:hypothetical protein